LATSASTNGSAAHGEKLATDDAARSGQTAVKEDPSLRFQAITQEKQHEDPIDGIRSDVTTRPTRLLPGMLGIVSLKAGVIV
jgi:hypothetical protein